MVRTHIRRSSTKQRRKLELPGRLSARAALGISSTQEMAALGRELHRPLRPRSQLLPMVAFSAFCQPVSQALHRPSKHCTGNMCTLHADAEGLRGGVTVGRQGIWSEKPDWQVPQHPTSQQTTFGDAALHVRRANFGFSCALCCRVSI